ncbi:MAG: tyrosine-type recombinase/integrase [Peptococcaceae bacterium]|nr:tyrosine-type recombinase/integrase [Peptococcaceae bacterium]
MVEFESVYGSFISQYIAFKRSLGYKYTQAEFRFRVFDRFAVKEKCEQVGLTKDLFEKWMEPIPNEKESNRYRRVNELINFSRYLNDLGIASYCPRNIPHIRSGFSPYIFTHDEISRFFAACDENLNWGRYPTEFVYTTPALFRLLYGTGLRISEALHLETEDVHLDDNYLLLRNTKNNTERMVPFSTSVEAALRQYSDYKEKIFGPKTKYFFANAGDSCWSKGTAYEQFRRILVRAQIPHTEKGPRLHDFRHTFAVHTLAEMSSQGLDLYYSLPILSKYLGHASLEATDHYVRLTAEMYPELLQQANQLCAYVFPEVSQVGA